MRWSEVRQSMGIFGCAFLVSSQIICSYLRSCSIIISASFVLGVTYRILRHLDLISISSSSIYAIIPSTASCHSSALIVLIVSILGSRIISASLRLWHVKSCMYGPSRLDSPSFPDQFNFLPSRSYHRLLLTIERLHLFSSAHTHCSSQNSGQNKTPTRSYTSPEFCCKCDASPALHHRSAFAILPPTQQLVAYIHITSPKRKISAPHFGKSRSTHCVE